MSSSGNFIGQFYVATTAPNATLNQAGRTIAAGDSYVDSRTTQSGVTAGGSLMVYVNGAWYGVNLTSSTSTTTTTTSSSTTTT
jgi:hypothetical protein